MTEITQEAPTYPPRQIAELLAEMTNLEGRMLALGQRGAYVRAELKARAHSTFATEGVAPTWRSPDGMGTVSLAVSKTKVVVDDPKTFESWAAQVAPSEVTARVIVPADRLEAVLELLAEELDQAGEPPTVQRVELDVRATWADQLLKDATVLEDRACTKDGTLIDGVAVIKGGIPGNVSIRLSTEAKNRAAAEAADPDAAGIFAAPIGKLVDIARAQEIREHAERAHDVDDAAGEPDPEDWDALNAGFPDLEAIGAAARAEGGSGAEELAPGVTRAEAVAAALHAMKFGGFTTPEIEAPRIAHDRARSLAPDEAPEDGPDPTQAAEPLAPTWSRSWKVGQLREVCEQRGLDIEGTKPVLIDRLELDDAARAAVPA